MKNLVNSSRENSHTKASSCWKRRDKSVGKKMETQINKQIKKIKKKPFHFDLSSQIEK